MSTRPVLVQVTQPFDAAGRSRPFGTVALKFRRAQNLAEYLMLVILVVAAAATVVVVIFTAIGKAVPDWVAPGATPTPSVSPEVLP